MSSSVQFCWVKRIDNSRLLRQRDPAYARESGLLLAGAVVCVAIVLVCAWQSFAYVHTAFRLEAVRAKRDQVLEWNRTLRVEQAALLDPMRIDALARNRLGLEVPPAGRLIPLGPSAPSGGSVLLARENESGSASRPKPSSFTD